MKEESNDKRILVSLLLVSIAGLILVSLTEFDFGSFFSIDESSDAPRITAYFLAVGIWLASNRILQNSNFANAIVSKLEPFFGRGTHALLASAIVLAFLLVTEFSLELPGMGESAEADGDILARMIFAVCGFLCVLFMILHRPSGNRDTQLSVTSLSEHDVLEKFIDIRRADRIVALKQRAASLIFQGYILLILIISIVLGVGYFIPIAGQIAGEDATSTNSFVLASSRVDSLRKTRASLVDEVNRNARIIQSKKSQFELLEQRKPNAKDEADHIEQINELRIELSENIQAGEALSQKLLDIRSDLEVAVRLLPADFNELGSGIKDDSTTRLLVSANITRFGVLALAIYLVQILINLYRFNTRLAGYYRALADSLTLFDPAMDEIGTLVTSVAPPFDFGKEPDHMSKEIVESVSEATRKIVDSIKRKDS